MRLCVFIILLFLATPAMAQDIIDQDQLSPVTVTEGPPVDPTVECNANPVIPVTITPEFDDPAYDFMTPLLGVQQLAHDSEHSIHEELTMGLTRYQAVLAMNAPVVGVQLDNSLACMHVDHVDVTIGYRDVTVYIPSEIPNPSCGFDTVMGHEAKHIAVNRQVLAAYAPVIRQRLEDYLRANGAFHHQPPTQAIARIHRDLHDILQQTYTQMTADNTRLQQQVDSPQEYQRVSMSCGGQLQGIARLFRENVHY